MRKVDDGEKKKEKKEKKKIMTFIVATTSLPVDRPNADRLERRTLVPIVELYLLILFLDYVLLMIMIMQFDSTN